jgi:hypothetical protein
MKSPLAGAAVGLAGIFVVGAMIWAVGVSGVPNGADKEEAFAQAGIDRVVDQLK